MNSRAAEPVVIDALAARVATMSTLDLKADRAHRGNYEATTCFVRTWSRKRSALSGGFLILLPIRPVPFQKGSRALQVASTKQRRRNPR